MTDLDIVSMAKASNRYLDFSFLCNFNPLIWQDRIGVIRQMFRINTVSPYINIQVLKLMLGNCMEAVLKA